MFSVEKRPKNYETCALVFSSLWPWYGFSIPVVSFYRFGMILETHTALTSLLHKSIKGPSSLTWFTITIENSNTSKYSTGEKGERGKRKQSLFIEGTLLWCFSLPSYLSKQHKCNCLSITNKVEKCMDR